MYPPYPTKSFLDWVLSVFKSSPVDFKPMASEKMRQECLHYHLKPFGIAICSEEMFQNYRVVSFSKQILDIRHQMYEMHIHKDGPQKAPKPEVNKAMKQWIVETTHDLRETSNSDKKLLSAVTLLYIIKSLANNYFLHLDSLEEEIGSLLKFLAVKVDLDYATVPGYHLLLNATEQASRYVD